MNDYWNDPPEPEEGPECCGIPLEEDENTGRWICSECGTEHFPKADIEPEPETCQHGNERETCPLCYYGADPAYEADRERKVNVTHCRHGHLLGECDACDHEADLAFDAEREKRR